MDYFLGHDESYGRFGLVTRVHSDGRVEAPLRQRADAVNVGEEEGIVL